MSSRRFQKLYQFELPAMKNLIFVANGLSFPRPLDLDPEGFVTQVSSSGEDPFDDDDELDDVEKEGSAERIDGGDDLDDDFDDEFDDDFEEEFEDDFEDQHEDDQGYEKMDVAGDDE